MIFLTVATWFRGFDRLVKAVDELVGSGIITEEVIAQVGYSSYKPKHMTVIDFCSPDEFADLISKARLVISHAGAGTIAQAVMQSKPVIVVPRRSALGEVSNDHQFTTAKQFESEGKILVAYEVSELPAKLEQAKTFVPVKEKDPQQVLQVVQKFVDDLAAKKKGCTNKRADNSSTVKFWPYRILKRDDEGIKADLKDIMQHFSTRAIVFDTIVFIPNVGKYLSRLFTEMFGNSFEINFVTVRRASTVSKTNIAKKFVFKRKWLSNIGRHFEVLLRLIKYQFGISQKMVADLEISFNVAGRKILVIDDSVETGTTLRIVKTALMKEGAQSVSTACIATGLVPEKVDVDYSVYRYRLLRTQNSPDYYAV